MLWIVDIVHCFKIGLQQKI